MRTQFRKENSSVRVSGGIIVSSSALLIIDFRSFNVCLGKG